MVCDPSGEIAVDLLHFNCTNAGEMYENMANLSGTLDNENCTDFDLVKTTSSSESSKNVSWKVYVPPVSGFCNGSVWYVAVVE